MENAGLIYLFTGDGKGKTSAALGTAIRGIGHGWKVGWLSFYKEPSWQLSEQHFMDKITKVFPEQIEFHLAGKGFYIRDQRYERSSHKKIAPVNSGVVIDKHSPNQHQAAAQSVLNTFSEWVDQQKYDLIILDEVCNALIDSLISEQKLLAILKKRGPVHVVLTGRQASASLQRIADLVTEMKKLKHPFDQGKNALKGLDF